MNKEFFEALDLLEKEKGIPKEYMLGKVEAALITAFKRERGGSNVRVLIDENKKILLKELRIKKQIQLILNQNFDDKTKINIIKSLLSI